MEYSGGGVGEQEKGKENMRMRMRRRKRSMRRREGRNEWMTQIWKECSREHQVFFDAPKVKFWLKMTGSLVIVQLNTLLKIWVEKKLKADPMQTTLWYINWADYFFPPRHTHLHTTVRISNKYAFTKYHVHYLSYGIYLILLCMMNEQIVVQSHNGILLCNKKECI